MKNKLTITLLAFTAMATLVGCGNKEELSVKFTDAIPNAYVDEEYDVADILEMDEDVKYSLEAYYQNYYENKEYKLNVNGLKFTQTEVFDVSVVVYAQRGKEKVSKTKLIQVSVKGDPIDELLSTDGLSGFADTGITKEIITDEQYNKDGGKSSLAVYYQGNNYYQWGASVISPTNFRLLDYWTDKTWENTILRFWVYNPTEYDLEFQLRIADEYTKLVNIDWGQTLNIVQFAKPGEWTECLFPLHKVGVDHTLFSNEEGTRRDEVNVKVRWMGTPTDDPTPLYNYQFYIDGVDFVPASRYPDVDTTCYSRAEKAKDSLENMPLDDGWSGAKIQYSREVVRNTENTGEFKSKSSTWATFKDANKRDNVYSVIYNTAAAVQDAAIENAPDLSHGVLKLDIKFEGGITNTNVILIALQDWDFIGRIEFTTSDLGDGWRRLEIDMAPVSTYNFMEEPIRLGFSFPGVTDSNKSTAVIYIDNFHYLQDAGTPKDEGKPELETWEEGLENLAIDTGWNGSTPSYDCKNVCARNAFSRYSLKLSFDVLSGRNERGYGVTLAPEMDSAFTNHISAAGNKLEMDIKLSDNISTKEVLFGFVDQSADWSKTCNDTVQIDATTLQDGWYHLTYVLDSNATIATYIDIIRICIYFPGVTEANAATANVWLDNIFIKAK